MLRLTKSLIIVIEQLKQLLVYGSGLAVLTAHFVRRTIVPMNGRVKKQV